MLYEIEKAVHDRITLKLSSVRDVKVQKTGKPGAGVQALTNPAVYVSIEEGTFSAKGQRSFKQPTSVYVELEFQNLANEEERRKGAWLIVEGIVQTLLLQTLGLNIYPLEPKRFRNATDVQDITSGIMRVQLEFGTAYAVEKVDDEVALALLKTGLDFYLREPADATPDAQSVVNL